MTDDEQKGEVQHVCIYECFPQDDNPHFDVYEEISAEDLQDYQNAKEIVRGFMGKLETKQYDAPGVKNARMHDFSHKDTVATLNQLATFDFESANDDNAVSGDSEDTSTDSDEDESQFSIAVRPLMQKYLSASNSVDCFLLLVAYEYESDRFESEERLMIVQLPFREDVFMPETESTHELFQQIQDAFDNNLKKSVLYPYQEDAVEDSTDGEEDDVESSSEDVTEENLEVDADAYLYQRNGYAEYWYEFLNLEEEKHEDELLIEQTKKVMKQYADEDVDNDEIDDPLGEIESFKDIDVDDPPEGVEDYLDSGVKIEIGKVTIRGLTVREVLAEENIRFYEDDQSGEVVVAIEGSDPSFHPVGKGTVRINSGSEEEEDEDQEAEELEIFHGLNEYRDISQLLND